MVDAGGGPAGEGAWRKMEAPPDGAVDVVPLDRYDSARAKIAANLQWICAKAYGLDNIPEDLKDPFYVDQYEQEHIKPPVLRLLLSSELYCRVCSLILKGDQAAALQGHQSVIQALSRKGIYVMESDDTPVTDSDLSCAPVKMSPHMAMIDALMMAYTVEMISIEKVVASVKRFSTFSASKELPYDLEDAMVFWINKVNLKMREIAEKEVRLKPQLLESPAHQKSPSKWYWKLVPVRYRREHPSSRHLPHFPLLEDLMKDGSDGAALLTVVHYYCPEHMRLDDICLKEVTSMADSLYNLRLLREFSNEYLSKCCHLTLEDLLYAPLVLKPNLMVFIAELFWWFENVKPDFVQPRDLQEPRDTKAVLHPKSSRAPVPISNATKRSFMASPAPPSPADPPPPTEACARAHLHSEDPDCLRGTSTFSPSYPLLPLRQRQQKTLQGDDGPDQRHRSNSLTRADGQPCAAAMAWSEMKARPVSQPAPFALHYSVGGDGDLGSGDSVSLARSISKDSLASNIISLTPQNQPHPPMATAATKTNGKSLLSHVNMEDEDEELVAVIRTEATALGTGVPGPGTSPRASPRALDATSRPDGFFLEPLMPAVLRPAKEKQAVTKEDERGEGRSRGHQPVARRKAASSHGGRDLNRTFTPISSSEFAAGVDAELPEAGVRLAGTPGEACGLPLASGGSHPLPREQAADGFFLHVARAAEEPEGRLGVLCSPDSEPWTVLRQDSDSDLEDGAGEEESAKLQEDMQVREHEDKDDASGRSSPCLSSVSQLSGVSVASGSVRMTSFAERKFQRLNSYETKSSTSSSQKTTPDASESGPAPLTTWRQKREQSPSGQGRDHASLLASELAQLHMQLEEKRRAIEAQKKKMEALSARQRLKLGKAAFLHVVRKGKADSGPQPLRPEHGPHNGEAAVEAGPGTDGLLSETRLRKEGKVLEEGLGEVLDVSEGDLSIEKLSETISTLQQAILKISQQQEQLLTKPPALPVLAPKSGAPDHKGKAAIHFPEPLSPPGMTAHRKPPRLGQARSSRAGRPTELKVPRERLQGTSRGKTPTPSAEGPPHLRSAPVGSHTRTPPDPGQDGPGADGCEPPDALRFDPHRLHDASNQRAPRDPNVLAEALAELPAKGGGPGEEPLRGRASLIQVDLADLKAPDGDGDRDQDGEVHNGSGGLAGDSDQKLGLGFFFKDEQKAEDELARKRAAFLLKQQRKAEEARARKQQLEAEGELKRDEARRKAEEDRIRKEEEKARRELIKQEYLRRKQQQAALEEQGLGKPKARPRKPRPKSAHREESCSDSGAKGSSTPDNLSRAQSGSSLSLASAATTEPESVHSGGTPSQRVESLEALPTLSRNPSRSTDRDWETASAASSLASVAEYTGPKLFKEPSSKSNKPIIHNAISHCCLAGKVNEPHKNSILEELEKCDANHYIILFRDAGCQFRALYCYYPDTEEMDKLTGTGPKSVTRKMVDKLYKYSSDRKQFTLIPAKTMSVSVDALTIHNHLWQPKRPAAPKKTQTRK
ncbi:calmodulin-regulated spectrin-associated protein 1 isoform X2 [Tenrec ecaudatus]|uniref:calmodulin-regulated spectrin-associated protein 1 isoform X2 n=1 Tax=Tenrec ecaudatus TaxID=94439 RepID=UPI003F5AB06F